VYGQQQKAAWQREIFSHELFVISRGWKQKNSKCYWIMEQIEYFGIHPLKRTHC